MGHGKDFDRRGWMLSGKRTLPGRSKNGEPKRMLGAQGGRCIGAESKEGETDTNLQRKFGT